MGQLIRKVPLHATTDVIFVITPGVSATGARCSVSLSELQHMQQDLRRPYRKITRYSLVAIFT
jgi:hypothetical protein